MGMQVNVRSNLGQSGIKTGGDLAKFTSPWGDRLSTPRQDAECGCGGTIVSDAAMPETSRSTETDFHEGFAKTLAEDCQADIAAVRVSISNPLEYNCDETSSHPAPNETAILIGSEDRTKA